MSPLLPNILGIPFTTETFTYQSFFGLNKSFCKQHLTVLDILPVECDERKHIVRLSVSFVHGLCIDAASSLY